MQTLQSVSSTFPIVIMDSLDKMFTVVHQLKTYDKDRMNTLKPKAGYRLYKDDTVKNQYAIVSLNAKHAKVFKLKEHNNLCYATSSL